MTKENTYLVPVQCTLTSTLVVKANSQLEAIKKTREVISKNQSNLADKYDTVKILESQIECEQDDIMLDTIIEDFDLKTEIMERPLVMCEGEDIESKEFQVFTSDISIDGGGMPKCITTKEQ